AKLYSREFFHFVREHLAAADWAGLSFVEAGELTLGPQSGRRPSPAASTLRSAITYDGTTIGELAVGAESGAFGTTDGEFLEAVARAVAAHCLVGWDTGGVPWDEVT
ncbi:MAG: hypothetical protein ACE5EV_06055, partial [Gaiellales bacterium]